MAEHQNETVTPKTATVERVRSGSMMEQRNETVTPKTATVERVRSMVEQRNETVTPKTATVEPVRSRSMAEQRNETVTPKTATVEPVEATVAVRSNQAVTETVHVQQVPQSRPQTLPSPGKQSEFSTYGAVSGMTGTRRQMKASSSNKKEGAMGCCLTICGYSFIITILIIFISNVVPIVIGAVYFNDCQLNPKIPIFLIVLGCLLFTYMGVMIIGSCCIGLTGESEGSELLRLILKVVTAIFHFVNLGVGVSNGYFVIEDFNLWKEHSYDVDSPFYCHSVLYLFAFVYAILQLAYSAIVVCCSCCSCCCCLCGMCMAGK